MSKDPSGTMSAQPRDNQSHSTPAASPRAEIDRFLDQVKAVSPATKTGQHGRLIFALDATMSRQPTWGQACKLQAEMFREAAAVAGLAIQLVYYRCFAECRVSMWMAAAALLRALAMNIDSRECPNQIST